MNGVTYLLVGAMLIVCFIAYCAIERDKND